MGRLVNPFPLFRGKRVFLTGDTGFKGSWLALWLHELGAEVAGYALPPLRDRDHYVATGIRRFVRHTDGDIRDLESLRQAMQDSDPQILFHLAAQPLVRLSYRSPKETFDINVGGSVNVLEAARTCRNLQSMVFITTDKCYRNKEWVWGYRENDELGGHDPYSASKAAAEIVISSYRDSFFSGGRGLGVASARAGNVIGGGDWSEDRLVPDCVRALETGKPIMIRNPSATRPWQHVLEPLYGYLLLAAALMEDPVRHAGAWNFGPSDASFRTVKEMADLVIQAWGSGRTEITQDPQGPHEARLLHLNCDKARQDLGWSPRYDFPGAVRRTIAWYKAADKAETSLTQIREYMEAEGD